MPESLFFYLLIILMPVAAFLYGSVGHGGASSYITLLTLSGFAPQEIRPTALLLNILVSGIAFYSFRKTNRFDLPLFFSLIIFSVPASYLGGTIHVDPYVYQKILGVLLLFPALKLCNIFPVHENKIIERSWWMAPALGLSIGMLSGMMGIGGGIILSPVLLLLGWTNMKETAVISSIFIFLNSIAGFVASKAWNLNMSSEIQILLPLTLAGGIAGAYLGANKFNAPIMKYILASVLLIAAVKFLMA